MQALRIAAVAVYASVGWIVWHRQTSDNAQLANRGFSVWWLGLAALGVVTVPAGFGWNIAESGLTVWRIWIYVLIPVIYVALGGLLYYMLYLYTGRHGLYKPIVGFYVLLTAFLVWVVEGGRPFLATDEGGETVVEYATPLPDWVGLTWSLLVILPVLVAAIMYGALFFRTHVREVRYRIALVSGGIVLWFTFSFVTTLASIGSATDEAPYWQDVTGQLLGLLAASMALLAFMPPLRIRRWFEGEAVGVSA